MKTKFKLLFFSLFAMQIAFAQTPVKISALPSATGACQGCLVPVLENGVTKKIAADSLRGASKNYVDSIAVAGSRWSTQSGNSMSSSNSGNVGIGTNTPTSKLQVVGNIDASSISATEINAGVILSTGGADFGNSVSISGNLNVVGLIETTGGLTSTGPIALIPGAGAGKVLTSDANGVGTWQTPSGGGGAASRFGIEDTRSNVNRTVRMKENTFYLGAGDDTTQESSYSYMQLEPAQINFVAQFDGGSGTNFHILRNRIAFDVFGTTAGTSAEINNYGFKISEGSNQSYWVYGDQGSARFGLANDDAYLSLVNGDSYQALLKATNLENNRNFQFPDHSGELLVSSGHTSIAVTADDESGGAKSVSVTNYSNDGSIGMYVDDGADPSLNFVTQNGSVSLKATEAVSGVLQLPNSGDKLISNQGTESISVTSPGSTKKSIAVFDDASGTNAALSILPDGTSAISIQNPNYGGNIKADNLNDDYTYQLPNGNGTLALQKYKVYTALLNQSGTNAPVAVELENSIGTITWTRLSGGNYRATCSTSAFTLNKTWMYIVSSQSDDDGRNSIRRVAGNVIDVLALTAGLDWSDAGYNGYSIEIRVYN